MAMHRWHVEHRDGREWTYDDLGDLGGIPYGNFTARADFIVINEYGDPYLVNRRMSVTCHANEVTDDMVVVWDD